MNVKISIVSPKRVIKAWDALMNESEAKNAAYYMWKAYNIAKLDFAVIVDEINQDGTLSGLTSYGLTAEHADTYCNKIKFA